MHPGSFIKRYRPPLREEGTDFPQYCVLDILTVCQDVHSRVECIRCRGDASEKQVHRRPLGIDLGDLKYPRSWTIPEFSTNVNRLSLHLGKTESILFGPKRKINVNPSLEIVCNGSEINHCSVVKYLGAELDQSLDGEVMAGKVLKKVYSRLKNLYRKSKFLNQNTKKLLASALVQCHYDYSCSFWYSSLSKQTKSKLQISQNKLVRFTLNLQPMTHLSSEHFKILGWLPYYWTTGRTTQIKSCYRVLDGKAPLYLSDYFLSSSTGHSQNTRSSQHSLVIPHHGSYGKSSFIVTGANLYNSLPSDLVNSSQSLLDFKKKVKRFIYDRLLFVECDDSTFIRSNYFSLFPALSFIFIRTTMEISCFQLFVSSSVFLSVYMQWVLTIIQGLFFSCYLYTFM